MPERARLRDLVLVVREDEVEAAAASRVASVYSSGFRQCPVRKNVSSVSRPQRSSAVASDTSFPTDLCISSPANVSIPLCIQICANAWPSARDCAISFS